MLTYLAGLYVIHMLRLGAGKSLMRLRARTESSVPPLPGYDVSSKIKCTGSHNAGQ